MSDRKVCPKCGEEKPATLEFFHACKSNRSGLVSHCKECRRSYMQGYRSTHDAKQKRRSTRSAVDRSIELTMSQMTPQDY